ncbi:MAG TPA: DegQ family serine endoprotease [Candidatus Deferrimicrobiaceae bacterium]
MVPKGRVIVLLLAAVAAGVVLSSAFNLSPHCSAFSPGPAKIEPAAASRLVPIDIPALFKEVSPAVVNISTTQIIKFNRPAIRNPFGGHGDPFDDFFNNFFGGQGGAIPREQKRKSLGSGFIVSADGYILTNNHVVENADEVTVTLLDKEEFKAKVIGNDAKTDIALIKIDPGKKVPYVALGESSRLEIGEWVIAIGNPFGLGHTVTAGIVSAKGRIIGSGPYDDFIQTDASINPGNSGGPLFNLKGEVVGINTAIVQGGQGIGFATPIDLARNVMGQLKDKGKVTRAWLGVHIQKLTPDMAESLNIPGGKGVLVADTTKDGPAEKAGLKSGDVIVAFDGKEVVAENELPAIVAASRPGSKVDVKVIRDGREMTFKVTLTEMEGSASAKSGGGDSDAASQLGIAVQDITAENARKLGTENRKGVVVMSVENGSKADDAGFEQGDIIRQVNRQPVGDVAEFSKAVKKSKGDKVTMFLVERGEARIFLAVKNK